jgi:hypothetical protein
MGERKVSRGEVEDLFENETERMRVLNLPQLEREQELARLKELRDKRKLDQKVMHLPQVQPEPIESDDSYSSGEIPSKHKHPGSDEEYPSKRGRFGVREPRPDFILKAKGEVKLEHVESIRIGRDQLVAWINQRDFDKTITGTFVRVNIGTKKDTNETIYMMCEVEGLQEQGELYDFGGKKKARTRKMLVLRHGKSKKSMRMEFVSNTSFSQKEFDDYEGKMQRDGMKFISHDHVAAKLADIHKANNYQYTSEEIDEINEQNLEQELKEGRVGVSAAIILEKWQVKMKEAEQRYQETQDPLYQQAYNLYDTKIRRVQESLRKEEEEASALVMPQQDLTVTQDNTPEEEEP